MKKLVNIALNITKILVLLIFTSAQAQYVNTPAQLPPWMLPQNQSPFSISNILQPASTGPLMQQSQPFYLNSPLGSNYTSGLQSIYNPSSIFQNILSPLDSMGGTGNTSALWGNSALTTSTSPLSMSLQQMGGVQGSPAGSNPMLDAQKLEIAKGLLQQYAIENQLRKEYLRSSEDESKDDDEPKETSAERRQRLREERNEKIREKRRKQNKTPTNEDIVLELDEAEKKLPQNKKPCDDCKGASEHQYDGEVAEKRTITIINSSAGNSVVISNENSANSFSKNYIKYSDGGFQSGVGKMPINTCRGTSGNVSLCGRGFSFTNQSPTTGFGRAWNFYDLKGENYITVSDAPDGTVSHTQESYIYLLPRRCTQKIAHSGGKNIVVLPTCEQVEFDAKTQRIIRGAFTDGPVQDKRSSANVQYQGDGVMIRANSKGSDARLGSGRVATVSKRGFPSCTVPVKELWPDQSEDSEVKFNWSNQQVSSIIRRHGCRFQIDN